MKKTPFYMVRSVAFYIGPLKDALHAFKFRNKRVLSVPLAKMMMDFLIDPNSDIRTSEIDMIVPVPLSRKKKKVREYNQAELLGEELSKGTGIVMDDESLVRIKDTTPQFELSREERLTNLKDAFFATDKVTGRTVLLIDDIYTTGATVREAASALMKAGAKKVCVLTLARTV